MLQINQDKRLFKLLGTSRKMSATTFAENIVAATHTDCDIKSFNQVDNRESHPTDECFNNNSNLFKSLIKYPSEFF